MQGKQIKKSREFNYEEIEKISGSVSSTAEFCKQANIRPGSLTFLLSRDSRLRTIFDNGAENRKLNRRARSMRERKQRSANLVTNELEINSELDELEQTVLKVIGNSRKSFKQIAEAEALQEITNTRLYIVLSGLNVAGVLQKSYPYDVPSYELNRKGGRK